MSFLDSVKNHFKGEEILREWIGNGAIPVDKELAQTRANTCLVCVMNQPGKKPVEAVAAAIKRFVEFKNAMRLRVNGERRLLTCEACECPTRLKIWLPLEKILPEPSERGNFDERCWLLTETKP